jgi:hypothetical protein
MRMHVWLALLGLALVHAPSALLAQEAKSVTIAVTDERGEAITELDECSLKSVFADSYPNSSKHCSFRSVPYGLHMLRVVAAGFHSHDQAIAVYQPEVYVRVSLPIADYADYDRLPEAPPFGTTPDDDMVVAKTRLRGTYQGRGAAKSHIVRIVPLFANGGRVQDARVEQGGAFELSGMTAGEYYLLVVTDEPFSPPKVVLARPVKIPVVGIIDLGRIGAASDQ